MRKLTKTINGYKFAWYTKEDILKMFPEAKKIIPKKIKEWIEKCENIKKIIREILEETENDYPEDVWFIEMFIAVFFLPTLYEYERHLLELRIYQNIYKKRKNNRIDNYEKFKEKIEVANSYPITELARDKLKLKQSGNNFVSLCPFHDERTPSFYLYTNTNTFICFGCGERGGVINLTMCLYGLDFKEAVEMLQK